MNFIQIMNVLSENKNKKQEEKDKIKTIVKFQSFGYIYYFAYIKQNDVRLYKLKL